METGIRVLLLTALLALPGYAATAAASEDRGEVSQSDGDAQQGPPDAVPQPDDSPPPRVVEPEVERRTVTMPGIHASNFELGVHYGALAIEDFGTNPAYGATLAYHVTEDIFLRGDWGRSSAGISSEEADNQGVNLLGGNRHFTYYDLSVGYNFLPGEVFLGRGTALVSTFYVLAGIGATEFGGDKKFTVNFGGGYQVLPTDWLAIKVEVEDHMFQSSLIGYSKLTNNIEVRLGTSVFF